MICLYSYNFILSEVGEYIIAHFSPADYKKADMFVIYAGENSIPKESYCPRCPCPLG